MDAEPSNIVADPATSEPQGQLGGLWRNLGALQRTVVGAVLVGIIAAGAWALMGDPPEKHAVLFAGLSAAEAGRVVEELQRQKVPYELEGDGSVITVPADRVHETRISLASSGLPGDAVGFELFDEQSFGTTRFVEQLNYRRGLEGELARTITSLEPVERARVHISVGERSIYQREEVAPTASVMLSLRPGQQLSRDQARGVVNIIAASVPGMTADAVSVVDQNGKVLSSGDDDQGLADHGGDLETTLVQRVENILEPLVGPDNARVTVTAEMDAAQVETTQESFEQAPDNVAIRSESRSIEGAGAATLPRGLAGARGNLPGAPNPQTNPGAAESAHVVESTNYEVNRKYSHTVGPKTKVRRLHVAIVLDTPTDEEGTASPRSEEALATIAKLASEAAGLDPERGDRIEVHEVPFAPVAPVEIPDAEPSEAAEIPPMYVAAAAGAGGLLTLVPIGLLWRRKRKKRKQQQKALPVPVRVTQLEAELAKHPASLDADAQGSIGAGNARDRALTTARADPELATRVVASWLADRSHDGVHA